MAAYITVRDGDLVEVADVEPIVNAWNRNIVPWWLLYPSGVSKAIRRRAGWTPSVSSPATAARPWAQR